MGWTQKRLREPIGQASPPGLAEYAEKRSIEPSEDALLVVSLESPPCA